MKRKICSLLVGLLLIIQFTQAQTTIYVDGVDGLDTQSGTQAEPVKTIGKAVELIASSGTVIVAQGIYTLASAINIDSKNIEIIGNRSVLDGTARKFRISGTCNVILKGLTLQDSYMNTAQGGAIYFIGTSLEIDSCRFLNNTASAGGAVYSAGQNLSIYYSYFEGNEASGAGDSQSITSNGSGGAIVHLGQEGASGNFILRNSTLYQNKTTYSTVGNEGTAVHVKSKSSSAVIPEMEIINCLFYGNLASRNNNYGNDGALHMFVRGGEKAYIINNTFWKNKTVAGINGNFGASFNLVSNTTGDVFFVNNVIAGGPLGIVTSYKIANRKAIEGWNNVLYGTYKAFGSNVDDACFQIGNSNGNILAAATAVTQTELDALYLNEAAFNTANPVPYIPVSSASSILVNAGVNSKTLGGADKVPATDIRGIAINGDTKDIGAFEYVPDNPTSTVRNIHSAPFEIIPAGSNILVKSASDAGFSLNIVTVTGQIVKSIYATDSYILSKSELPQGILILVANDGVNSFTKKIIL